MGSREETKAQSVTNMSTLVEPGKTRDPKPLAGEGQAVWLPPPDGQARAAEPRREKRHICAAASRTLGAAVLGLNSNSASTTRPRV